jgi:hypothetical protein
MGEGGGVYRVLVRKPEGKRPLGRPRHGWGNYIKEDLQEGGFWVCTGLSWLRRKVEGTFEYGNEPSGSIKCREFLD